MIAKVSVKRAIEACGRAGPTTARHLIRALEELGVEIKGKRRKLVRDYTEMPKRCLQLVEFRHYQIRSKSSRHWRILWDGQIYDPEFGLSPCFYYDTGRKPSEAYWSRVTLYIEL